jgi:hypothetical protein
MSEMKASHVVSDVATIDRPQSRTPARRRRLAPRDAGHPRSRRRVAHSGIRFASGLVLIAALVAAGVGVEGMLQASRARSQVSSLQGQVTSLERRLNADEQTAASARTEMGRVAGRATGVDRSVTRTLARINWSLQSVPSEGQLARLRGALDGYAACVGQLQSEIEHLGISWKINSSRPSTDSFKLFTAAPAGACSAAP